MQKALSAQRKKTDRNDARGIAHMMRVGWFRQVHVKSSESQNLSVLLSNRRLLKRKFIDVENEVRGTLKAFGIKIGKVSRGQFEGRAMELVEAAQPLLQDLVRGMLQVRRITHRGRTLRAHAQTVPIRHHRLRWPYHTLWGRRGAHCALRGGERLDGPQQEMVRSARLGRRARQAPRAQASDRGGRSQTGRHPPSDVA